MNFPRCILFQYNAYDVSKVMTEFLAGEGFYGTRV